MTWQAPGWLALSAALAAGLGLWACSSSPSTGTGGSGGTGSTTTTTTTATTTTATTTTTTTTTTGTGGSGGADPCPGCETLAQMPFGSGTQGLFVDAENVYWTNATTGEVMQAKKDGSSPVTLAAGQSAPYAVHVVDGFVYWISYAADGVMRKVPIGGGDIFDIVGAPAARELVVKGGFVYWTREPDDIERVPIDGVPDGGMTLLLSLNALSNGITADQDRIYWVNRQDGTVKKADVNLGSETTIGIGDQPWDIAVDAQNVYWTERGSNPDMPVGKVVKASKTDGAGVVELATTQDGPRGIAIDAAHVYWANQEGGTVLGVPIAGGAAKVIASAQEKPVNVAVDDAYVYWVTSGSSTVMRAPKPK